MFPQQVFTDPQIAYHGLTEHERCKGFRVFAKIKDYADVAYGWRPRTRWHVKLIADSKTASTAWRAIMDTSLVITSRDSRR